ncbi:hypothetical protein LJR220_001643 [Bradyrhizobium sp. LjRoot220]|uniref:hypothetical protein n=1 Tax=Bradyrhizobium sp. LjRoot220 TaxID=3342284 RepID=UPI003ECD5A62
MYPLKLHLNWFKDSAGYRFNDYGKYGTRIIGNGGKLLPSSPLENDCALSAFASVTSVDSLMQFVEEYGLLNVPAYGVDVDLDGYTGPIALGAEIMGFAEGRLTKIKNRPILEGEDVDPHLETAKLFRDILGQSGKGWRRTPPSLARSIAEALDEEPLGEICLASDREHGFRMVLTANSLMDGLWLQLGQKVAGQALFRTCELLSCRQVFEVGSSSGRRLDARFCSDAHRIEFNSRKRTKGS